MLCGELDEEETLKKRGYMYTYGASQMALVVKNLPANEGDVGDAGSFPASGRAPGGVHGNANQYFCLENPMDRGTWWGYSS